MILNIKSFIILPFILSLCGPCSAGDIVDDTLQSINLGDVGGVSDGLKRGLDVNYADHEGNTLLILATRNGSVETVALLLNAGARVYPSNVFGDTALLAASYGGFEQIADLLLARGGSLGPNSQGWTPLHYAAYAGHIRLVNKFLGLGSQVNARTNLGLTPLMVAAMNGYLDVVKSLLNHGADPMLRDANDRRASDHALTHGNTDIADILAQAQGAKSP